MMHMLIARQKTEGFALPTILIASVIMLTVLITAVTAVSSSSSLLSSQYYNELAREAAESGVARAESCLSNNNYTPTWTDAAPLRPNMDCNGVAIGGADQWVVNNGNIRTTFTVGLPQTGAASSVRVVATGTVQLVRSSSSSQVWRTYTATVAQSSRYNDSPQIAGGAGWKTLGDSGYSGHNGYMLASNGTLYGWGDNSAGQLGPASLGITVSKPVQITLPSGVSKARKIYNSGQGASILCMLATNEATGNQIYCRGSGGLGGTDWQRFGLANGLSAVDMSLSGFGEDSGCVLASDSQVYCAGFNDNGLLGNGLANNTAVPVTAPTKFRLDLANPGPTSGSAADLTVKKVFTQDRNTCVIASDGKAYCAGDNYAGQLGQGNFTTNTGGGKSIPGRALIPGNPSVADISFSYHNNLTEGIFYRTTSGEIYMSGNNTQGTAVDGSFSGSCANGGAYNCYNIPKALAPGGNYGKIISIGERGDNQHAICLIAPNDVVMPSSGVFCVGTNTYGEIGLSCTRRAAWTAELVMGALAPGERVISSMNEEANYQMNSAMFITTLGNVYAAGDNTYGKLGRGTSGTACNSTFEKVQLPSGVKATAIANNDEYSAFILGDNGKVYAIGRNNNGQLGDGTTTNRSLPVEVKIPRQETVY